MLIEAFAELAKRDNDVRLDAGLNFKLDVGTLRSYQQVACQRYRQTQVIAKTAFLNRVAALRSFNAVPALV